MNGTAATHSDLADALARVRLFAAAIVPVRAADPVPDGTRQLVLLSPREPDFWDVAANAPEFHDGAPDPLDRISRRIIAPIAARFGATPIFPFEGPLFAPFMAWALRSGQIWSSPLGLLVSRSMGLFVSFRGALALRGGLALPDAEPSPCDTCQGQPCRVACPVSAFSDDAPFDVAACHAHLALPAGQDCMDSGCAARRACPLSQNAGRRAAQSAFHMRAFHP